MICWGLATILSGIGVIRLAYLCHGVPRSRTRPAPHFAPYYIWKAAEQCVAANLFTLVGGGQKRQFDYVPLPDKQTLFDAVGMSQRCQERTHALQRFVVIRSPRRRGREELRV